MATSPVRPLCGTTTSMATGAMVVAPQLDGRMVGRSSKSLTRRAFPFRAPVARSGLEVKLRMASPCFLAGVTASVAFPKQVGATGGVCMQDRCLLRRCVHVVSPFAASRTSSLSSSTSVSFAGVALRHAVGRQPSPQRGWLLQVRAKVALGCTKRSRSRKSIARVSGFRARMKTTDGRNVLKRRRAKGRKDLVPKTNPNSGRLA